MNLDEMKHDDHTVSSMTFDGLMGSSVTSIFGLLVGRMLLDESLLDESLLDSLTRVSG